MPRQRTIGLLVLALALPRWGAAATNLGPDGYPPPKCGDQPAAPDRPGVFTSESELESYNAAVEAYNEDMESFVACLQRYVDGAVEDIKEIKRKAKAAIEESQN